MASSLQSLISEYGHLVDGDLIASIWAEQQHDPTKCHNIIRMLSGQQPTATHMAPRSITSSSSDTVTTNTTATGSHSDNPNHPSTTSSSLSEPIEAIDSPKELVDFLEACFPECGRDYLLSKVDEIFRNVGGEKADPVEALDMVANSLYNDQAAVDGQEYRRGTAAIADRKAETALDAIEAQYTVPCAQKGKRKGKGKARKGRNTTMPSTAGCGAESRGNAWESIGGDLESLCAIFPMLSTGTVRSAYHRCGASIDRAVGELAGRVERTQVPKPAPGRTQCISEAAVAQTMATLRELFADVDEGALERAARETADFNAAIDRVFQISSEPKGNGDKAGAEAEAKAKRGGVKWHRAPELSRHRVQPTNASADRPAVHDVFDRVPLAALSGAARQWASEHRADPAYCRQRASELLARRNELYTKAASAYGRRHGLRHHGGTALYYSAEGHRLDARARVWRMRAAQASVAEMRRADAGVVDLHGLTRAEAVAVVLEEVERWHAAGKCGRLHAVTGLGNHSVGGRACLHPSVVKALREQGWWFEEGRGYVDVLGVVTAGARMRFGGGGEEP